MTLIREQAIAPTTRKQDDAGLGWQQSVAGVYLQRRRAAGATQGRWSGDLGGVWTGRRDGCRVCSKWSNEQSPEGVWLSQWAVVGDRGNWCSAKHTKCEVD